MAHFPLVSQHRCTRHANYRVISNSANCDRIFCVRLPFALFCIDFFKAVPQRRTWQRQARLKLGDIQDDQQHSTAKSRKCGRIVFQRWLHGQLRSVDIQTYRKDSRLVHSGPAFARGRTDLPRCLLHLISLFSAL